MLKSPGQTPPDSVEILEGIAKITNSLKKEWVLILWNQIKRDLLMENLKAALVFLQHGNYDPATKNKMIKEMIPEIVRIMKGDTATAK